MQNDKQRYPVDQHDHKENKRIERRRDARDIKPLFIMSASHKHNIKERSATNREDILPRQSTLPLCNQRAGIAARATAVRPGGTRKDQPTEIIVDQ